MNVLGREVVIAVMTVSAVGCKTESSNQDAGALDVYLAHDAHFDQLGADQITNDVLNARDAGEESVIDSSGDTTQVDIVFADYSVTVSGPSVAEVSVGEGLACARLLDGSVWCWGSLPPGFVTLDRLLMVYPFPHMLPGLPSLTQLESGERNACAITRTGQIWCWGNNPSDRLGTGSPEHFIFPAPVRGVSDAVKVVPDDVGNYAVLGDGRLVAWGDLRPPRIVEGLPPVSDIAAGSMLTCARTVDGHVWCWGSNLWGALGVGSDVPEYSAVPVLIPHLTDVTDLSVSTDRHACALRRDGTVWCWGSNSSGQSGDFDHSSLCNMRDAGMGDYFANVCQPSPVLIPGVHDAVSVAVGFGISCLIRLDSSVWCWGSDLPSDMTPGAIGTIGDGLPANEYCLYGHPESTTYGVQCRRNPSRIARLDHTIQLSLRKNGPGVNCALQSDHHVWCWGDNQFGDVGDGSRDERPVPVPVVWSDSDRPDAEIDGVDAGSEVMDAGSDG